MKALKIKTCKIRVVFLVVLILAYSCNSHSDISNIDQGTSQTNDSINEEIVEIEHSADMNNDVIDFWSEEISQLSSVKETVNYYDSFHINCTTIPFQNDSSKFQVLIDDAYRLVPLLTFYVYPNDSIIKQLDTENDSLFIVYPNEF